MRVAVIETTVSVQFELYYAWNCGR